MPQKNGNILRWLADFAEQRRLNLTQLHCLAEPKLERERIVFKAFVMFKFDEGFYNYFDIWRW
jgi:hypothetical protein